MHSDTILLSLKMLNRLYQCVHSYYVVVVAIFVDYYEMILTLQHANSVSSQKNDEC